MLRGKPHDVVRNPCQIGFLRLCRRQLFSGTLAEQEKELKSNALMLRFARSRQKLAAERIGPPIISSVRKAR